MKKFFILSALLLVLACNSYKHLPEPARDLGWKSKVIPPSPQTKGGDPDLGFDYMVNGDYLGSGIPFEMMPKRIRKYQDTVLNRSGINQNTPYIMTAFEENGVAVVNGNCLSCHAGKINGEVMVGLGNSFSDLTKNMAPFVKFLRLGVKIKYGKKSPEWDAYKDFDHYFSKAMPYSVAKQRGVNTAANIAEACAAFRDPITLEAVDKPILDLAAYTLPTDVPPLWNVKKKNALYYTAVGRGDFTKLIFQASIAGVRDSTEAREAVTNFKHVIAWINQLEPPKYPGPVDQNLAKKGAMVFREHCSGCHGTYGENSTYPNKVLSLDVIKTDPYYATYAVQAPIVDWYNKSWFATSQPLSHFEPEAGYIAPPLDGIWASAPYLHNGSVPTVATLLDSKSRPSFWQRSGDSNDYNYEDLGWNFKAKNNGSGKWTYDTSIPGMSNSGHYFGDKLQKEERKAVIEYLKTL